jgi:SagB-type dehydrogenase family enzyme
MLKSVRYFKVLFVFILIVGYSISVAQEMKPVKLPAPQTETGKPLMQALKLRSSSRSFESKPLPLQELSNLLWAADGINRPEKGLRTAPSAMNWQEIDIYVTLPEGAYIYNAKEHRLDPVSPKDLRALTGKQDFVKTAPLNLVYVADMKKVSRVSEDEAKMWNGATAGFIAQNVYLYCASQGFAVVVRGLVERTALAGALNLRPEQKIILCQTVGYSK